MVVRSLVYAIITSQYVFSLAYDFYSINIKPGMIPGAIGKAPGGRSRFFTYWNLILQTVYFAIALLNDLAGSNENVPSRMPFIRRVKDYLFSSLAFPLAMFVGISFWALMAIDRELVFPKVLDEFFPTWLNHVMHTNIVVFIILEMFLSFRQYPSRKSALYTLTLFMMTYLIWVHVIYYYSGFWVYPVLQVLNWPLKIAFYVLLLSVFYSLYFIGEFVNNKIWGKQLSQIKKLGKKRSN